MCDGSLHKHTLGGLFLPTELHTADMTKAISSSQCFSLAASHQSKTKNTFIVDSHISPSKAGAVRY